MKRKLFLTLFFISGYLFSQQEQKSIELPDFVITGRQSVEVQPAIKKKPELFSILAQEFFTPQYSPEELPILFSSRPQKIVPAISAGDDYNSGKLFIGGGRYMLPVGNFSLSKSFDNVLLSTGLWGSNTKEYISNAGYNASGANFNSTFFVDTDSDVLAGTIIKLDGDYWRDNYKFYGSFNPTYERKTNRGSGSLSIKNDYYGIFNFGLKFNADFTTIVENNIKERVLSVDGGLGFKLGNMTVGGNGIYTKQIVDNNIGGIKNYNFYLVDGFVKLIPTNDINLILGIETAGLSNNSFFSPFALLHFKMSEGLSFDLNFKPHAQKFTIKDFLLENPYLRYGLTDNVFREAKFNLNGAINYEFDKLFAMNVWGNYSRIDNFHFYEDTIPFGFFDLLKINGVKLLSAGINLIVYPNQFGFFKGEVKFQDVKDSNGKYVPYNPSYLANLSYSHKLTTELGFKFEYTFADNSYSDILNKVKLNSYHNLSANISYEVIKNLSLSVDFQNILNRSNFVLKGYQEKPFDILLGAEYRW